MNEHHHLQCYYSVGVPAATIRNIASGKVAIDCKMGRRSGPEWQRKNKESTSADSEQSPETTQGETQSFK